MKISLFISLLLLTLGVRAEGLFDPGDAMSGVLYLTDGKGKSTPATPLNSDAHIAINGPVANVTLTQQFHNSSRNFREGRYQFPLPENAA